MLLSVAVASVVERLQAQELVSNFLMIGGKVVLTYKRKRSSVRTSPVREDGCPRSYSSDQISIESYENRVCELQDQSNDSEVRYYLIETYTHRLSVLLDVISNSWFKIVIIYLEHNIPFSKFICTNLLVNQEDQEYINIVLYIYSFKDG